MKQAALVPGVVRGEMDYQQFIFFSSAIHNIFIYSFIYLFIYLFARFFLLRFIPFIKRSIPLINLFTVARKLQFLHTKLI